MKVIVNLEECIMQKLKLSSIALTTVTLSLGLSALDINSVEANEITKKPTNSIEIVSTEMNIDSTENPTTERPSTEPKSTETPTVEKKTDEPKIVIKQSAESDVKRTEKPVQEKEITKPIKSVNVPSKPTVPTTESPKTIETPVISPGIPKSNEEQPTVEYPDLNTGELPNQPSDGGGVVEPTTPAQPGTPSNPGNIDPPTAGTIDDSKSEEDKINKPGKFSPTKGEAYYTALDKHVGDLVTAKIEKSGDKLTLIDAQKAKASDASANLRKENDRNTVKEKSKDKKKIKSIDKKQKEDKEISALPETGETTSLFALISALFIAGIMLVRKK